MIFLPAVVQDVVRAAASRCSAQVHLVGLRKAALIPTARETQSLGLLVVDFPQHPMPVKIGP